MLALNACHALEVFLIVHTITKPCPPQKFLEGKLPTGILLLAGARPLAEKVTAPQRPV